MVHLFMLLVQFSDKVFDVVHSPFEWLDHRVPLQLSLPRALRREFASRCRVVVEVLLLIVLRFCLGQREADDWKIHRLLFSVPRRRWVCMHAELLVQQQ